MELCRTGLENRPSAELANARRTNLHLHAFDFQGVTVDLTRDSHFVTDVILNFGLVANLVNLTIGYEYQCLALLGTSRRATCVAVALDLRDVLGALGVTDITSHFRRCSTERHKREHQEKT